MQIATTITPKFQVHIPKRIREKIGMTHHGRALIGIKNKTITIIPVKDDFVSLGGSFSVKKPIPAEQIRKHIDYIGNKK